MAMSRRRHSTVVLVGEIPFQTFQPAAEAFQQSVHAVVRAVRSFFF